MTTSSGAWEAIRELLARYCELVDAANWDELGALFADGALADPDGRVLAAGADAVAAFYRRGTLLHDGSPRTTHVTANVIIDLEPAGSEAQVRSTYVVFQAAPGAALQPIITGRYRDRVGQDADGTWRFRERRFLVDSVGDLSRHLAYELR